MKPIPSFESFEKMSPLESKADPRLVESLSEVFSDPNRVDEGIMDSIKNTLSKTFLGSFSHINLIDKVRQELLRMEKELITKRYSHLKEIESLKNDLAELRKSGNTETISKVERSIDIKRKEYENFAEMTKLRISKGISTLEDGIKGNKRRLDYWQTGRAEDEADLAEFEYNQAKKYLKLSAEKLKGLEDEVKVAKENALKAKQEEEANKIKNQKKGEQTPEGIKTMDSSSKEFLKMMNSPKGRIELVRILSNEKNDMIAKLKSMKDNNSVKSFSKKQLEKDIARRDELIKDIEEFEKKNKGNQGAVLPADQFSAAAKIVNDIKDEGVKPPSQTDQGSKSSSSDPDKKAPEQKDSNLLPSKKGKSSNVPSKKIPEKRLENTLAMLNRLRSYNKFNSLVDNSGIITWVGSCFPSYNAPDTTGNIYQDEIKDKFPRVEKLIQEIEESLDKIVKFAKPYASLENKGTDKIFADPKCVEKIEKFLEKISELEPSTSSGSK